MTTLGAEPLPAFDLFYGGALSAFSVGAVYFHAGNIDRALPQLLAATKSCRGLTNPIEHVQAFAMLGRVYEAKGDRAAACNAYRVVVERWGGEKASVSANHARARMLSVCEK